MRSLQPSIILLSSILFFSGCATLFGPGIPSDPLERLTYDIDAVLADSVFRSTIPSVRVVDPKNGQVLYERNSNLYIRPASNMKILTSATALYVLGPRYQFKTSLAWDTAPADHIVDGNLYLKGYGNPDLTTSDLDSMAARFADMGVKKVSGNIIVDAGYFDSLQWGMGWMWDDEPAPYQAYVSALTVNKNCIYVTAAIDTVTGQVAVTTDPQTSYVTVRNEASVATDSVTERLQISRPATEAPNTILVSGQMREGRRPYEEQLTVLWPDLYAGTLVKEALQRRGIDVAGKVVPGRLPDSVSERIWHTWGIDSMVINLMKVSDNLSAEMSLKMVGAVVFGPPGNVRNGRIAENSFFGRLGMDTLRHRVADGSGLSHYNLLRIGLITDLLVGMYHREDIFPLFYAAMPIGGVDGTLEDRMRATRAEGNVHAKTGTISGVSSLSGYVTTRDGEMLVFGMTMQDFVGSSAPYRYAQDRICEILANFSRAGVITDSR